MRGGLSHYCCPLQQKLHGAVYMDPTVLVITCSIILQSFQVRGRFSFWSTRFWKNCNSLSSHLDYNYDSWCLPLFSLSVPPQSGVQGRHPGTEKGTRSRTFGIFWGNLQQLLFSFVYQSVYTLLNWKTGQSLLERKEVVKVFPHQLP